MKVEYIKNHNSGKVGDVKEVADEFGYYLILSGKAKELKSKRITKEDKTEYKTKDDVSSEG